MRRFIVPWLIGLHCSLVIDPVMAMKGFGYGKVRMNGEIVASACAIEAGSAFQSISLGSLPIKTIEKQGYSPETEFTIRLINCELTSVDQNKHQVNYRAVRVTFDGIRESDGKTIAMQGNARGVGLTIKDAQGNTVIPGVAQPEIALSAGETVLKYALFLSKNNHQLKVGRYQANVRFMMEYL